MRVHRWSDPVRGDVGFRTLFDDQVTGTEALTVGVVELEAEGWLARHRHAASEVYYVVQGVGVVELSGVDHRLEPGSAVFIPADVEHAVRNIGPRRLRFVYTFAVDSLDDIEYHFADSQE